VLGLEPLPGHEESHEELAAALAIAREDTADVAEDAEESGAFAAAPLLWEWRAALFGVRLALARVEQPESPAPPRTGLLHAAWPVALLFAGVGCVLAGALVEVWAAVGRRPRIRRRLDDAFVATAVTLRRPHSFRLESEKAHPPVHDVSAPRAGRSHARSQGLAELPSPRLARVPARARPARAA
jgi:hypothetical protein